MSWREKYLNQIVCGDCLELMPELPDKCVDIVITDPPYFLPARHYGARKYFPRTLSDISILDFYFKHFAVGLDRLLKSTGTLYMFCDGQSYPVFYAILYSYFKSLRPLVWDKLTSINGYGWRHQHELIIYAERDEAKPIPTGDGDILKCRAVKIDDREHPAEKPEGIITALMLKSSQPDDVVADFYCGTGVVPKVAKLNNRNFIGIDIDPGYCEIARKRLAQEVLITPAPAGREE